MDQPAEETLISCFSKGLNSKVSLEEKTEQTVKQRKKIKNYQKHIYSRGWVQAHVRGALRLYNLDTVPGHQEEM